MRIRVNDGREFEGTPLQIVQEMKSIAFGHDSNSLDDYIDWVKRQTEEFMGLELTVQGETTAQKAESLVEEMLRVHLAARVGHDS